MLQRDVSDPTRKEKLHQKPMPISVAQLPESGATKIACGRKKTKGPFAKLNAN